MILWNLRDVIGVFLVIAFISTIPLLIFNGIPDANEQLIAYMLGQLSGFVAAVVAFHYVTKAGEREQEQQRVDNTTIALEAITNAQKAPAIGASPRDAVEAAADEVADAAVDAADIIKGDV